MAINATDFTFRDKKLSDFGFIIANFDSSSDDDASCGNIEVITERPPMSDKNVIYGVSYGEPIKLSFQIVKFDFVSCICSETPVTDTEYEELMRWLVKSTYNYLNFDDSDIYFNVTINVTAKKVGGKIRGFEITATNDAVYSYSQEYTTELVSGDVFTDESSVIGYTYPEKVVITALSDGDLYYGVYDDNDKRTMYFEDCVAGEILTIDCEHKIVSSSVSSHDLSSCFNFVFFNFCNNEETRENKIIGMNVSSAQITYRFKRMVTI